MKIAIQNPFLRPVYPGYANGNLSNRFFPEPHFFTGYFHGNNVAHTSFLPSLFAVTTGTRTGCLTAFFSTYNLTKPTSTPFYQFFLNYWTNIRLLLALNSIYAANTISRYALALRLPLHKEGIAHLSPGRPQARITPFFVFYTTTKNNHQSQTH